MAGSFKNFMVGLSLTLGFGPGVFGQAAPLVVDLGEKVIDADMPAQNLDDAVPVTGAGEPELAGGGDDEKLKKVSSNKFATEMQEAFKTELARVENGEIVSHMHRGLAEKLLEIVADEKNTEVSGFAFDEKTGNLLVEFNIFENGAEYKFVATYSKDGVVRVQDGDLGDDLVVSGSQLSEEAMPGIAKHRGSSVQIKSPKKTAPPNFEGDFSRHGEAEFRYSEEIKKIATALEISAEKVASVLDSENFGVSPEANAIFGTHALLNTKNLSPAAILHYVNQIQEAGFSNEVIERIVGPEVLEAALAYEATPPVAPVRPRTVETSTKDRAADCSDEIRAAIQAADISDRSKEFLKQQDLGCGDLDPNKFLNRLATPTQTVKQRQ